MKKFDISFNITLEQETQLRRYASLLAEENAAARLTGPRDATVIYDELVADCVHIVPLFEGRERFIDVGTGGGLPGIPLAMLMPETRGVLIDSIGKKVRAVERIASALGCGNIAVMQARAEDAAGTMRETFDAAVARAVAAAPIIAEYLSPFVRVGGIAAVFKGPSAADELAPAEGLWSMIGLSEPEILPYSYLGKKLSIVRWEKIRKIARTYPRRVGEAESSPWYAQKVSKSS